MKRIIFLIAIVFAISTKLLSQTAEVVIFSQDGERFWVVIDGTLQNEEPMPRVQVGGLSKELYRVKIIFEDEKIPDIDRTISTRDIDEKMVNTTYRIFQRRRGYAMWPHSWEEVPPAQAGQQTISLQTEGLSGRPERPRPPAVQHPEVSTQETVVISQSVTIKLPDGTTISYAPGAVIDAGLLEFEVSGEVTASPEHARPRPRPEPDPDPEPVYNLPGYRGPIGCSWPMDDSAFNRAKSRIGNQSFESDMLDMAKQVASNNCLLVSQVVEIVELFGFESSRLEFAKFAYKYTYDLGNYYEVNDAFSFSSSKQELNDYINKMK